MAFARGIGIFLSPDLHLLINDCDKPDAFASSLEVYKSNAFIFMALDYRLVTRKSTPFGNLPTAQ